PRTRPYRVHFDDIVADVITETTKLAEQAVRAGVPEERVFIDPTHDFGKNTFHGLELLRRIDEVVATGWPVLMALSNKDFIGETLERGVDKRVAGTLAATAWAAARGVAAFRVHEVAETFDVLQMTAAIMGDVAPLNTIRGLA
ncbi:dihydropteroate synthase, partial [Corynebacterium glutamicum]